MSGLNLNVSKTEGFLLGNNPIIDSSLYDINWPDKPIRCLGIYIGYNKDDIIKKNWDEKIEKMVHTLNAWKYRNLTLLGKILIIKSLAISQLIFSATNTAIPSTVVSEINKILYKFIWNSNDKIKRNTLIGLKSDGGLQMIDTQSLFEAIKAAWVTRIIDASQANWNILSKLYMEKLGSPSLILYMTFNKVFSPLLTIPDFYREVFVAYNKSKLPPLIHNADTLLNQVIWGNRQLTIRKGRQTSSMLYFRNWIDSNIIWVKDLKIANGKIDQQYIYSKLTRKANWFSEYMQVMKALQPYKHMFIVDNIPQALHDMPSLSICENETIHEIGGLKTKFFYKLLLSQKFEKPHMEMKWRDTFNLGPETEFTRTYHSKIITIRETKLSEFNYKILNGILPCATNLMRWKIETSNKCWFCQDIESMLHLLFYCPKNKIVWDRLNASLSCNITAREIVLGTHVVNLDFVITLICYTIFKHWLITRSGETNLNLQSFIRIDLAKKKSIYSVLGWNKIVSMINKVIARL